MEIQKYLLEIQRKCNGNEGKAGARSAPGNFRGVYLKYKGNTKEMKGKPARETRRKIWSIYFLIGGSSYTWALTWILTGF